MHNIANEVNPGQIWIRLRRPEFSLLIEFGCPLPQSGTVEHYMSVVRARHIDHTYVSGTT